MFLLADVICSILFLSLCVPCNLLRLDVDPYASAFGLAVGATGASGTASSTGGAAASGGALEVAENEEKSGLEYVNAAEINEPREYPQDSEADLVSV